MNDQTENTEVFPTLEGFTFIRLLGRGGMASVWEAQQYDPERLVAIKILNDDISDKPEDVEKFYTEAKNASQLDHENIVTVFEVGCQNGVYYYVMELAAGYDIRKLLQRKGRIPLADVLTIAESVAVALDYAEKTLHIIHCDIKPANIMVDIDGTVRLTDLGIARFERTGTDSDDILGTPCYMSPEQARGEPDLDFRSDIYSLGATIYNLVSGKRLFESLPDTDVLEAQCHSHVRDVRDFAPEVPYPFAVLIAAMLAKDKNLRPESWSVVIRDLDRVRHNLMPLGPVISGDDSTMALRLPTEEDNKVAALSISELVPTRNLNAVRRVEHFSAKAKMDRVYFWIILAAAGILSYFTAFFIAKYFM